MTIENRYAKIIDEETHEVQLGVGCPDEYYVVIGMTLMDVEQAYNNCWYEAGYAPIKPEPTIDEKKIQVRNIRNNYLSYWDFTQLNDAPFTEKEKEEYRQYRQYLRDYPDVTSDWYEHNPMTFDEWKEAPTETTIIE